MQKISRIPTMLLAGACVAALAACGKSQQQTYVIPEETPKVNAKNIDAKATSLRLADAAYEKGEYAMAAGLYFRAAELQPDKTEVMVKLGFALFKAGSPSDAEKIFRAALEQNPKQPDALRGLAHSLVMQGRAAEAVAIYRQALAGGTVDVRIHAGLGAALDMTGKHEEARATYQAGLKHAPEDYGLRNNLALSYAMSGQGDKAKSILNGLSQSNPGLAPRTNLSLSTVNTLTSAAAKPRTAAKTREVAETKPAPAAKSADDRRASRLDTPEAPDTREVAEIPPPARPAAVSRKPNVDLAGADSGEGEIYIDTGRAKAVHAETARKSALAPAMSFKTDTDSAEDAAAEVLDLLQQAERGPRFVWQEARRPERS